ncbi:MAG: DUF2235 domain-containing protein [Leptolyngbyaceae bacterium]|nr:DUF2235 domain-containing protein [Leptolyngbyaceae bacterium]
MKRLVVCCDGTWQSLEMEVPSNVVKIAQACKPVATDGTAQYVFYDEGLGTSQYLVDKFMGGAFGAGIDENIQDAYRFLCLNYVPGDEVYLFGFSRGAYTVRSLAGLIYCSGLLPRHHVQKITEAYEIYRDRNAGSHSETAKAFGQAYQSEPIPISFMGCWDTVGSLGIPELLPAVPLNNFLNKSYRFHDRTLNPKIQVALHAMAIDENLAPFEVTHMEKDPNHQTPVIKEVWFPGTHGCVGGGTKEFEGLSDGALQWMMAEITDNPQLGLEFDQDWTQKAIAPNPATPLAPKFEPLRFLLRQARRIGSADSLHPSVRQRYDQVSSYRPQNLLAATGWTD